MNSLPNICSENKSIGTRVIYQVRAIFLDYFKLKNLDLQMIVIEMGNPNPVVCSWIIVLW